MTIMTPQQVIETCRAKGIKLRADLAAGCIRYRPRGAVDLRLYNALCDLNDELVALLSRDDPEIAWRVEAMRAQVPAHGPILALCARLDVSIPTPPGMCASCGEPREAGQTYVCRACQAAKRLTLEGTR
jgi:hypothetical protein